MAAEWEEYEHYRLNLNPQQSRGWLDARKGRFNDPPGLVTGSNLAAAAGMSQYKTPKELGKIIRGEEEEVFSEFAIRVMAHGTNTEPIARKFYEDEKGVTVTEKGLGVSKHNPYIGSSLDGMVDQDDETESDIVHDGITYSGGIIEIKCPLRMYSPIEVYLGSNRQRIPGKIPWYIKPEHYCQMQGGMWVFKKAWCDYVVFATESDECFIERFHFDPLFWDTILYPKLQSFIETEIVQRV